MHQRAVRGAEEKLQKYAESMRVFAPSKSLLQVEGEKNPESPAPILDVTKKK
jgi:hypothetical protein